MIASDERPDVLKFRQDPLPFVKRALDAHLPGQVASKFTDRGEWVRRIFEITLDSGEAVYLKVCTHVEWLESASHETQVVEILHQNGLPAPNVLAVDASCQIIPFPFVIQEARGGARLGNLLSQLDKSDILEIFETLGVFYRRLHSIHSPQAGVWTESPSRPWGSPTDFMFQAEILSGSGKRTLEKGEIDAHLYKRIVDAWRDNLDYLKDFQPSLVHGSPFLWTIYLEKIPEGWSVTKLSSLGDVLWWDPTYDLAFLQYPPFGHANPDHWASFGRGYGVLPEQKRILLYTLMQRLCAANDVYMQPDSPSNRAWAKACLEDLEVFLDEIES